MDISHCKCSGFGGLNNKIYFHQKKKEKKKKVRRGVGKTPTGLFTEKPHPITRKEEIGAGCTIN